MKTKSISFLSIIFCLFLFPVIANAQFGKDDKLVEGTLGNITVSKNKYHFDQNGITNSKTETNAFGIAISPRIGYFVANNFVVGVTLGISYNNSKLKGFSTYNGALASEEKSDYTTLGFLPFVRYYFPSKNTKTRFYGQVGGGITTRLSDNNSYKTFDFFNGNITSEVKYDYPKKYNTISGEALVGINYFIAPNVAVNAALGYNYGKSKWTQTSTQTTGGITVTSDPTKYDSKTGTFAWNVGFSMIIPSKKKK